ncbi:sporulation histidine kinase inhibitor Sda [Halalkalibacter kiskunsagensis]|uniref:Sporulation histidine kinase inhibitor Sda n=1 Tax=Halalkalibacter kiskunsagensis TaxID=1548599 RepID=A0ABV6KBE6_9BACI
MQIMTHDLLEVYEKAIEMNLERDFIEIVESELVKRGAYQNEKAVI